MNRLDIVGMVVSPRPSHSFGVDMVGHDVVVIGELQMAERAFPALVDDLAVEQISHFCVRAEFPVSPRMIGVFNPLHTKLIHFSDTRDWLPATAG